MPIRYPSAQDGCQADIVCIKWGRDIDVGVISTYTVFKFMELRGEEGPDLSPEVFRGGLQAPAFCWILLLFLKFVNYFILQKLSITF